MLISLSLGTRGAGAARELAAAAGSRAAGAARELAAVAGSGAAGAEREPAAAAGFLCAFAAGLLYSFQAYHYLPS